MYSIVQSIQMQLELFTPVNNVNIYQKIYFLKDFNVK